MQYYLLFFSVLANEQLLSTAKIYFNNNGPLQLNSTINISNGFSLKFRTCDSGPLIYQGNSSTFFAITLYPTTNSSHSRLVMSWRFDNRTRYQSLSGLFSLDRNDLIEIDVLMTDVTRPIFRILNPHPVNYTLSSLSYLVNSSNAGPLLLGLRNFTGCLYNGRNVNLSTLVEKSKLQVGCPLEDQRPCASRGEFYVIFYKGQTGI